MPEPLSIHVGETAEVELSFSEVCCHMRVAGERRNVTLLERGMVQILNEDGSNFSFPITHGEAGIYRTEAGNYYHY